MNEITDAKLRTLKYKPLQSKGLQTEGVLSARTGKPLESRPGQLLPNYYSDRDGMHVAVSPSGVISFRYQYRFEGRRVLITYGQFPRLSLAKARAEHASALEKLKSGINPMAERKQRKTERGLDDRFRAVSARWFEKNKPGKSNSWIEANTRHLSIANPIIGARKMKEITPQDLAGVIQPIESSGRAVSAEHLRQSLTAIFDWAAGKEFLIASGANPARVLSVDTPETKHHAYLKLKEVPAFLALVDSDTGAESVKLAIRLLFLTMVRKTELTGAKWSELDLDAARWDIPTERMKGRRPHVVPLSKQAVAMFLRLKELSGPSEWVFPHRDHADRCMADTTINRLITRVGYAGRTTAHGCRSTASSALNESGRFTRDAIEMQLAHLDENETRRSYNHGDFMQERIRMMQTLADWIDAAEKPNAESNVIPMLAVA